MRTEFKLKTFIATVVLMLTVVFNAANAQQSRLHVMPFDMSSLCVGYITFDATFTNLANTIAVKNAQLYITRGSGDVMEAIKSEGILKKFYDEIGTYAYKIDRFYLVMSGFATIGTGFNTVYSDNRFKLHINYNLGDFVSMEFGDLNRELYKDSNSWENSGNIPEDQFRINELNFYDYRIWEKN